MPVNRLVKVVVITFSNKGMSLTTVVLLLVEGRLALPKA